MQRNRCQAGHRACGCPCLRLALYDPAGQVAAAILASALHVLRPRSAPAARVLSAQATNKVVKAVSLDS
jgi:hypothetical protein